MSASFSFPFSLIFTTLSPVAFLPCISLLQCTLYVCMHTHACSHTHTALYSQNGVMNAHFIIPGNSKDLLYLFLSFLSCKVFFQRTVSCTHIFLNPKPFCSFLAIIKSNWWFSLAIGGYSHRAYGSVQKEYKMIFTLRIYTTLTSNQNLLLSNLKTTTTTTTTTHYKIQAF